MSVRDWHEGKKCALLEHGPVRIVAWDTGMWDVSLRFETSGDEYDRASAKRASKDALRQLCHDTLAALGDE